MGGVAHLKHPVILVPFMEFSMEPGDKEKFVAVAAGETHLIAITTHGHLFTWGTGEPGLKSLGQTGTGTLNPHLSSQHVVVEPKKGIGANERELDGETVVEIAGGNAHTAFFTSGGRVFAVGISSHGGFGLPADHPAFANHEFLDCITIPAKVPFLNLGGSVHRISVVV